MYIPPHFLEVDEAVITELVEHFPLATVVCHLGDEFVANHIPMLRVSDNTYVGHIAKENDLHQLFPDGMAAIAIFSAENAYISPNWYPSKKDNHRHVPTWNYQVVHMHGRITFDHARKTKLAVVGQLTTVLEQQYSGDEPWKLSDAPRDYMEAMLDNIVAFTFEVETIVAKSKLSQNREPEDFESVKASMEENGMVHLANAMEVTKAGRDS